MSLSRWQELLWRITLQYDSPDGLKGYKCDARTRVTITVNPVTGDSREVDVICWSPLVVGEVTTIKAVDEAGGIEKLLDSIAYAEKAVGVKRYAKVLAVEVAPSEITEYSILIPGRRC